jgi:hypothetical protein
LEKKRKHSDKKDRKKGTESRINEWRNEWQNLHKNGMNGQKMNLQVGNEQRNFFSRSFSKLDHNSGKRQKDRFFCPSNM